ncbi:glycosyltransferase family 4 protein [Trinickia caryophylli]|uniref:Glycosyltransferase involved in cell wall bisynthesis n=1 Tax=Trinickia caryophylli TaxID=28094 RepID=A0A1X7CI90_TRICW|nr:glycosyltransferase family 4 protein [Trinickia caryophylli]PMS11545.1 glycosyltransferase family 1 protein [Trinickia caryophylli]TRX19902.1 glycosyltransferase family 4 protein [Trinickia caryophylli]WQE12764.1 glycosyltransferase family 4 protein [Trinickia caryophylli]SME96971.1 Glycosyltransferase involved in cell wall bisynthesis [Trinickia caryophylli]GLU30476.1 glycosyl transferase [Trinickia caryophylli]
MNPHDTAPQPAAPLTVCLVCNTAWAIYTYRHGLIRTLVEKGARVVVIAPRDRTFALLEEMGCRTVDLFVASKGTNPRDDLRTLLALYRHYRAIRPEVVFHYTIKANIYGSVAAWLARVPSIAVTTGLGYVFIRKSRAAAVAKALYRFAFRFPRQVWFLNRDDHQAFVDERLLAHPDRARLLNGEGVDLTHFALAPVPRKQNFTFVLIGRLLWDKGVGEYVDAARILRARHPDVRFQLLGPAGVDNPSAISLETVRSWEREGLVEYLGEAHDVRPYIAGANCVVLPSYREGVPRTLMEASAMGRPIVATDVPGCRDVVSDGVTGLLCEAKSAASLAGKLEAMLALSDAQRREMGERGRERVAQQFDERAVIARYLETLAELTGVSL